MTPRPPFPPTQPTDNPAPRLQRRSLVQATAVWATVGTWSAALAQPQSRMVELRGDVLRNGRPLTARDTVATGDRLETGPGSSAVFTVGDSAFLVRENTRLVLEGESPAAVRLLRLLSGAVASVWNRGTDRQVLTPTLTAGIRGTGVYAEVFPAQDFRSYFCNCYGTVDVAAGTDKVVSESSYHQSYWAEASPRNGRTLFPAEAINHTDEEMEMLAALLQQRTAWQISGVKGPKDGRGQQYSPYRYRPASAPTAPAAPAVPPRAAPTAASPEPHFSPN